MARFLGSVKPVDCFIKALTDLFVDVPPSNYGEVELLLRQSRHTHACSTQ